MITNMAYQEAVTNLAPTPQLQVGLSFKSPIAMDMLEEMTVEDVPLTCHNNPLFINFHLKGMCSSKCGGRHAHRCLCSSEHGLLATQKAQFYCSSLPLVMGLDSISSSGSNITTKIKRSRCSRGGHTRGGKLTHYPRRGPHQEQEKQRQFPPRYRSEAQGIAHLWYTPLPLKTNICPLN